MRYWTATILGVGLFAGSVVAFSVELTSLLDIGTCASGNQPFVVQRECPEGTATSGLLLGASIFGLFIAAGLVSARGRRPSSRMPGAFLIVHGWALFFTATGAVSLVHALTSDTIGSDGKMGGIIVGIIFLVMGLPVLALVLAFMLRGLRRDERPPAARAPGGFVGRAVARLVDSRIAPGQTSARGFGGAPSTSTGDATLDQLERLQRLRDQGTLSEAEFAAQKARIVGG